MRQFAWIVALIGLLGASAPALAQNQAEIDTVLRGSKSCANCNMFQAPFAYMELQGANFSGARLIQASFTVTVLSNANLHGANLSHADMFGTVLTNANLANANLTNANLTGSWLLRANLSNANLTETTLSGARMETTMGLSQIQLNQACGDANTTLPAGLTIPRCN